MQALLNQFPHLNGLEGAELQAQLVALLEDLTIPLPTKVMLGEFLGQIGDPRPGVVTLEPDWVRIAGGPFLFGSSDDDPDADDHEKPQRTLNLSRYCIARYPVTSML